MSKDSQELRPLPTGWEQPWDVPLLPLQLLEVADQVPSPLAFLPLGVYGPRRLHILLTSDDGVPALTDPEGGERGGAQATLLHSLWGGCLLLLAAWAPHPSSSSRPGGPWHWELGLELGAWEAPLFPSSLTDLDAGLGGG